MKNRYTPQELAEVSRMLSVGTSLSEVARLLNRERTGLFYALRACGLPTKPPAQFDKTFKQELKDELAASQTMTRQQIRDRMLELSSKKGK